MKRSEDYWQLCCLLKPGSSNIKGLQLEVMAAAKPHTLKAG